MENNISAVIVVHNNVPHLMETINSIENVVAEIILVDIGMTNEVRKDVESNKKVVIKTVDQPVPYVELIREKSKSFAKNDYIIFLDPDEIIPSTLASYIKENYQKYEVVAFPRKNMIFNKWIEHARWWPDYQIRLFKKEAVEWPQILHAQPTVKGKKHKVEAKEELAIFHYNYESLDEFFGKMIRYAKSEANTKIANNESLTLQETIQKSISEFVSRYFAEQGYKDGLHGFTLSWLQMMYYFVVFFYYSEGKKFTNEQDSPAELSRTFFQKGLYETNHWILENKELSQNHTVQYNLLQKLLKFFK